MDNFRVGRWINAKILQLENSQPRITTGISLLHFYNSIYRFNRFHIEIPRYLLQATMNLWGYPGRGRVWNYIAYRSRIHGLCVMLVLQLRAIRYLSPGLSERTPTLSFARYLLFSFSGLPLYYSRYHNIKLLSSSSCFRYFRVEGLFIF